MKISPLKGLGILAALIAIPVSVDHWLPYSLLSHHNYRVEASPAIFETFDIQPESVVFTTPDSIEIQGWFIPAESSTQTLIMLHGLGATRQNMLAFILPFQQQGYNLALIDLRSHGDSSGDYFTYGYHEWQDVVGLIDWLEQRDLSTIEDITLIGLSAGGTVAISATAKDNRIDRLVTISTFADLETIIEDQSTWLPEYWRQRSMRRAETMANFDIQETAPQNVISSVAIPVLIAHGDIDGYIPFENAQRLFEAAHCPKQLYVIEGADHGDVLEISPETLRQKILNFTQSEI